MISHHLRAHDDQMTPTLLLLAILASPQAAKCEAQFAPMHAGGSSGGTDLPFFRKEEADPWRGDGWLGWNYDGRTLQPVRLTVLDPPKGHEDHEELNVETVPAVDFAARCIPSLRAGAIQSVWNTNRDLIVEGPLKVSLAKTHYEIRVEATATDKRSSDAKVVLTDGRRTQVLYSADGLVDDPHYFVKWAGDLDRDGKLDLIVNLSRKYTIHPYRLLLSSKAKATQLVGEAAVFLTGN